MMYVIFCKSSWVALDYNSLMKDWINRITKVTHAYAFHIDSTTLPDGTYELVPESESEQREAQVNLTEATKDPNQVSEEPKASYAQEGKPRSMFYLFEFMQLFVFLFICAFKLQELFGTLVAWS